jgi:hypothetical protein
LVGLVKGFPKRVTQASNKWAINCREHPWRVWRVRENEDIDEIFILWGDFDVDSGLPAEADTTKEAESRNKNGERKA